MENSREINSISLINLDSQKHQSPIFADNDEENLFFENRSQYSGFSDILKSRFFEKDSVKGSFDTGDSILGNRNKEGSRIVIHQKETVYGRTRNGHQTKFKNLDFAVNYLFCKRNYDSGFSDISKKSNKAHRFLHKQSQKLKRFWRGTNLLYPFALMRVRNGKDKEKGNFICREDISNRKAHVYDK